MNRLLEDLERAARALSVRGGAPPWKDHPLDLHIFLYLADEVSSRVKEQIVGHVTSCRPCRKRVGKVKRTGFSFLGRCFRVWPHFARSSFRNPVTKTFIVPLSESKLASFIFNPAFSTASRTSLWNLGNVTLYRPP